MAMKVMIFDVEHGACAFVKTPTNHTILVDCGCTEGFSPALYIAEHELGDAAGWNGHTLTQMVVTHPHDDHITEVEAIKQHCSPAFLLRQNYDWEEVKTAEDDYDNLDTFTAWQKTYTTPVTQYPDLGLKFEWFMLSPSEAKQVPGQFVNNSSIVLVLTVTGTKFKEKFLFGGDMETAGWEALLKKNANFRNAVKDVDFFIVSHHGHQSGFSELLYAAMGRKPYINIVSIHHNDEHIDDRYKQEAYASGTKVNGEDRRMLTTRRDGTITVNVTDEGQFWISIEHLADNKLVEAVKRAFGL
jgi:beta-lactamase superfamily II metal-dependent hydrolase